MQVERFDCTMYGVYWEADGYDNYGELKIKDPVEIRVRWMLDIRDGKDAEGHRISIDGQISCLQELVIGSIVWEGRLAVVPALPTPLYQIYTDVSGLDFKNRKTRYLFNLSRFKNALSILVPGTGS